MRKTINSKTKNHNLISETFKVKNTPINEKKRAPTRVHSRQPNLAPSNRTLKCYKDGRHEQVDADARKPRHDRVATTQGELEDAANKRIDIHT
jgi:hypothetical protein